MIYIFTHRSHWTSPACSVVNAEYEEEARKNLALLLLEEGISKDPEEARQDATYATITWQQGSPSKIILNGEY